MKKINCINTNININGNNTGNINIGNRGQVPAADAEGYLGASSFGDGNGGERYNDGFDCIINNNNTNINIVSGGNVTEPEQSACERCFTENLTPQQIEAMIPLVDDYFPVNAVTTLEEFCEVLEEIPNSIEEANWFLDVIQDPNVSLPAIPKENLRECLGNLGVILTPG